jgi:DNA-binding MarR family transcriptional regulator
MTSPLELGIGAIIAWATRADVLREVMRRANCTLPGGQVLLLSRLADAGPSRLGEIAEALGIEKSTLTPKVQRLEGDGLISRQPDPSDGRASLLQVTRKGRALLRRLEKHRGAMLRELLGDWPEADVDRASTLLSRLGERVGRFPLTRHG